MRDVAICGKDGGIFVKRRRDMCQGWKDICEGWRDRCEGWRNISEGWRDTVCVKDGGIFVRYNFLVREEKRGREFNYHVPNGTDCLHTLVHPIFVYSYM